jgi:hypothetical protein
MSTKVAWGVIGGLVLGSVIVYSNTTGDARNAVTFAWLVAMSLSLMVWILKS